MRLEKEPARVIGMNIKDQFDAAVRSNKVRLYRKKANVAIRPAVAGEVIETRIDCECETVNTAKAGDFVVCGVKGEQYVISPESLASRYGKPVSGPDAQGFRQYDAQGLVHAFRYEGPRATFTAPWGEEMVVNPGDYIGTTSLGSDQFYRIERDAFAATYDEVPA
jgi:hypothetical protein